MCVGPARAPGRGVLLILGLDGVRLRGQPVSCTYQGDCMTDSKARMRDLSDCEFSVSFAQRSAFIKVVKSGLILVRHVVAFNECYCFAASLWCCVYCRPTSTFLFKIKSIFLFVSRSLWLSPRTSYTLSHRPQCFLAVVRCMLFSQNQPAH